MNFFIVASSMARASSALRAFFGLEFDSLKQKEIL
jgi:hypothetical protein